MVGTVNDYCQSWGGCTSERSVGSRGINYVAQGSGKVIHPTEAGIGQSNCNSPITLGTAGTSLMKNIINWAGASSTSTSSISLTLTAPTTTTVSTGSALGPFSVSIANNTSSSETIIVSPYIYDPYGEWISMGYIPITLSANQTLNASNLYLYIPSFAPTGTYYHLNYMYDTDWNLLDYDYFSFTVSSSSSSKFERSSQDWKMSGWPDR
jgi:hypothetical protein